MTQTPNIPAGWYPQGGSERWWDGNAWTDHTRPLQAQPTMQQPVHQPVQPGYAQPQQGYAQPGYGQPQYPVQPVKQSHTGRNLLIVFGVLILLFVGGCFAVVAVIGNKVENVVNDDTLGGPNNPLTIEEGEAFEVAGFEYAEGWSVDADPSGYVDIQNLKVTNNRGKADQAWVEIKLLNDNEVLASSTCSSNDRIPNEITETLSCTSSDLMPEEYDEITINDLI